MSVADGYSIRSPTEADAPAVAALITAADSDTGEVLSTGDVLDDWRRVDLEHDAWLATAPDGSAAGFLNLLADEPLHVESDGYVHPAHVGRGLGSELIRLAEERAVLKGAGVVRNATLSTNRAAIALLESCGYRPARRYYRMVVDLREQPAEPEWPPGLRPEAYDPRQAEAFHAVHEEAFADEFGHTPESFEEFERRRLERESFDPSLWLAVWDGDEIAATLICDPERWGMGWIAGVGVRKPWRRGLGLALLRWALGEFYRRGERRVGLGVDAQNPTGATRLYERAGMRVAFEAVLMKKSLA